MSTFSNLAEKKNVVGFKDLFEKMVSNKVTEILDLYKIQVAQKIFNEELKVGDDDVRGDDEVGGMTAATATHGKEIKWPAPAKKNNQNITTKG